MKLLKLLFFLSLSYNTIAQSSHIVTFKVNTALITVGPNGIFVGAGIYGPSAFGLQLTDSDSNGIYEGTDTLDGTAGGTFTFLNSPANNQDWASKENLTGLPCGTSPYGDRTLPTFTQDTTLLFCFGTCSTDTVCQTSVSFSVDMNGSNAPPSFTQLYLSGTFNNWSGNAWAMTDNNGDNIWDYTAILDMNMTYEYKFSIDNGAGQEQFDYSTNDSLCTIISGTSVNRAYTTFEPNGTISYCYNSCNSSCSRLQLGADIDGEAADDYSGNSVSLSSDGTTVAIGATGNNGNGTDAGHVRIYEYTAGSWTQLGADIDGEAVGDGLGRSVSLSSDGTTVAIGATGNNGNGSNAGHVRIYEYSAGSWTQLGADIDGEAAGDSSGFSVSLSSDGTTLAIGACGNDGNGQLSGHVRIYEYGNGSWTQLGADIDGEAVYDYSGYTVSLSSDGTTVAIGAPGNAGYAGHVRIYEYSAGSWTQLGADIDGEAAYDLSGISVSLSSDGTTVAIGATGNNGNGTDAGHVRIYEYTAGSWTQLGADIDGEAVGDGLGRSVSLSSDGTTVAIGATGNNGNGSNAGHVRIYEYSAGSWTQLGADIDGEAAYDLSGTSVSLSSDSTTVAIGAVYNDGNGSNAGHVRVYSLVGNSSAATTNHSIPLQACEGDTVTYSFDITVPYNVGNSFFVELSNASGTFNGNVVSASNLFANGASVGNAIDVLIPDTISQGVYSVRLISTNPATICDTIGNIIIGESLKPILSYVSNGVLNSIGNNDTIRACDPDTVLLIADSTIVNGVPINYASNWLWYKNGSPIPGATNDSLYLIGSNDQGAYYVVESTLCDGESDTIHFEVETYTGSLTASGLYYNPPNNIIAIATGGSSYQWSADKPVFIDDVTNDSVEVALMSDSTTLFVNVNYGVNCLYQNSVFLRDTNLIICDVFDTSFVDVFDTSFVDVFDTSFVDVFDTIPVFDTTYVTQIDTLYLMVTDTLIIDVSLIGINPPTFEYQLRVYPNPTISYLYIEVPQNMISQSYSMEVRNSIGQSMFGVGLNQPLVQIDFNSFGAAGSYTLLLKNPQGAVIDTRIIMLQ